MKKPALGEKPFAGRVAELTESFSAHGCGQMVAKSRWKTKKDQADVSAASDVIGDEEDRAFALGEIIFSYDERVGQKESGGPG